MSVTVPGNVLGTEIHTHTNPICSVVCRGRLFWSELCYSLPLQASDSCWVGAHTLREVNWPRYFVSSFINRNFICERLVRSVWHQSSLLYRAVTRARLPFPWLLPSPTERGSSGCVLAITTSAAPTSRFLLVSSAVK